MKKMKCAKLLNSSVPMEPDKEPEAVKDLLAAVVKEAKPVAPVAVEAKAKAVKEAEKAPAKAAKVAPVEKVVKAKVKDKEKVVEIVQVPDKLQAKEPKKWGNKPPNNTLKDKEVEKAPVVGPVPVPVKVVEAVKAKVKVKAPEKVPVKDRDKDKVAEAKEVPVKVRVKAVKEKAAKVERVEVKPNNPPNKRKMPIILWTPNL